MLGLPSDVPDLWNFNHMDSWGVFTDIGDLVGPASPTGTSGSGPGLPVLQDKLRLSVSETTADSGAGTLLSRAESSLAWPVFLGNLGLGPGWTRLGSGVRRRVRSLLLTLLRDQATLLRNMKESCCQGFCFDHMVSIGIGRLWDPLIHCWRIGNVGCDDMMGVMTLFDDDLGGPD